MQKFTNDSELSSHLIEMTFILINLMFYKTKMLRLGKKLFETCRNQLIKSEDHITNPDNGRRSILVLCLCREIFLVFVTLVVIHDRNSFGCEHYPENS